MDRKLFVGKLEDPDDTGGMVSVGPFEADCHYEDTVAQFWQGEGNDALKNATEYVTAHNLIMTLREQIELLNAQCNKEMASQRAGHVHDVALMKATNIENLSKWEKEVKEHRQEISRLKKRAAFCNTYEDRRLRWEADEERLEQMVGQLAKRLQMWVDGSPNVIDHETKALLQDAAKVE